MRGSIDLKPAEGFAAAKEIFASIRLGFLKKQCRTFRFSADCGLTAQFCKMKYERLTPC